jgi:hypothetical protein
MLKGPRLEKKPNIKGSKNKKRTKHLPRGLKAPNMHKKHAKRIKNTKHLGRGSKAPSMHGKLAKRIENTKRMPRLHNKDR